MRRKFRKKLAPLLFCISEHKSFCAKRKKLLGSIIGGANYPKGAYGADWRKPTKPTRAKDVRLLLFLGLPLARQRCECTNKGRLGKLLTHFADCSSASFNFYSAFLGGRCLAQFIVASLMSPDVQKDVGALFVCGCPLARQLGYVRTRGVLGSSLSTSRTARPLRSTFIVCS
mgnify:CR=1 FL=1